MKKYILSGLLIFTFTSYVIYQRTYSTLPTRVVTKTNTSIPANNSVGNTNSVSSVVPVKNIPVVTTTVPEKVTPPNTSGMMNQGNGMMNSGQYKNGTYTGDSVFAYDSNLQVSVTILGGKISDVTFPVYPTRGTSRRINEYAMPILRQEAITAQSANVDSVSSASYSSDAFRQSLGSALAQAKN